MAIFHMKLKSHKKGQAADRSRYIAREGKYANYADDVVTEGHGNLPAVANGDPLAVWKSADKNERANGCASREQEIALPNELDTQDHVAIVMEYIERSNSGKPYQFAIHRSIGKLSQQPNTHVHLLESDRIQDQIDRPLDQIFRRFNPDHPERGGCRKESGGRNPATLRQEVQAKRELMAGIINAKLEARGHSARVDHRSLKEQGIEREPERHLGPGKVRNMLAEEKLAFVKKREQAK
ncbi:plasmid mobilization protein [Herbaspirillum lusitanum]|uniref:MobA/MobL family protein n=1 Tax=Herbaspirillum lusitanum TaxID=213312 RepID=UPI002239125C|nr:MobA/MobL family protein [Herbaspirillum lusitanum]MCW5297700.1 plasmid mobilization protein [Herbaspirillum lusitanum]